MYEKSKKRQDPEPELINTGVSKVLKKEGSVRQVALALGLKKTTLQRHVNELKLLPENERADHTFVPQYGTKSVFIDKQEILLREYLITASKMHFGLTRARFLQFAYEFGTANDIEVPKSWTKNKEPGKDWLFEFFKRHPRLSVRKPESRSLSRSTSFNRPAVEGFFNNLEEIYQQLGNGVSPTAVYNLDETALTTVQKPPNVIAEKGTKQVGNVTSGERGTLVTACRCISAAGNSIPPYMIFPRVNFKDHMLNGAPTGNNKAKPTKSIDVNVSSNLQVLMEAPIHLAG